MGIMSSIEAKIDFKIAGDDMLSFVGSRDKNANGEIYSVDITFNLSKESYLAKKRFLDVIFACIALVLLPISFLLKKEKSKLISNILHVLKGKKTWVAYSRASEFQLPHLQEGVVDLSLRKSKQELITYAKDYSTSFDILPFLKYLIQ